jgi:hypothetical protein
LKDISLKYIQSKLSSSNIIEELFSSFTARWALNGPARSSFITCLVRFSHQQVMEMEIEVLHQNFTKKDPKLLVDYIQSAMSGEAAFFPTTLSLVYDRLIGKVLPKDTAPGPEPEKNYWSWGKTAETTNPFQASSSTSTAAPFFIATPAAFTITLTEPNLMCIRCCGLARLERLYDGLFCPRCSDDGKNGLGKRGRPYMKCSVCNFLRTTRVGMCPSRLCEATFV